MKLTLLIGALMLAIVGAIGYTAIYLPQERQVRLIREERAQALAVQQTQAEVAAVLHEIEEYRIRLPQEPDPSWLVREVVALAQRAGVDVTSVNQDAPQAFPQFTRLAATLQFSASYHELGALLDGIERSTSFIRVERIQLKLPDESEGRPTIEVALSTLYLPPSLAGL